MARVMPIRARTLLFVLAGSMSAVAAEPLPERVEFNRDIRPILADSCYHCHGPDKTKREAKLRFDTREGLFGRHDDITIVLPGKPAASELYRRVTSQDADERMPPADSGLVLSDRQVAMLKRWIEQGASWQTHWSFIPARRPATPDVDNADWARNPIDRFVLARLEAAGLVPTPPANRSTLARRLSLDLTGLPPDPRLVDSFLADRRPGAWERLADRVLASPRLGEHLASRWLDAARYADTSGYQNDGPRTMWRWRDWVTAAFNANMPFDQFTIEQLAGDLLPDPTLDQRIATAFNRNHRGNSEGGVIAEEYQVEYVVDRVDTTATVWLGLTLKCARCHEHKYDPFSQREFYRVYAFFNNIPENGRAIKEGNSPPYIKAPTPAQQQRLAELDRELVEVRRTALKLQPVIAMAQRRWEALSELKAFHPSQWTLTDGLVARFPLDGDARNTVSKAAAAETREGQPAWSTGRRAGAASFDGRRFLDAGNTGDFGYYDKFSLVAWIRPERVDRGTIISRMTDTEQADGYYLSLSDGHVQLNLIKRWLDDSIRVESTRKLTPGKWVHIAVSYDGSRLADGIRLYLDGKPVPLKVNFDFINQSFKSTEPLRIGGGGGPAGRFTGLIDDVGVYDRDLSAREMAMLAVPATVDRIVALPAAKRSPGESARLRAWYLESRADAAHRRAVASMVTATRARRAFFESLPTVMVMHEMAPRKQTFVLTRGRYDRPGKPVTAGLPAALPPMPEGAPANRLGFARWLVDRDHPLTARVTVNRIWQGILGNGLVRTTEDFGSQGERPSHPLLLDWLATELVRTGWDTKALIKTIVTSATYRQASRVTPEQLERDPENRMLGRAPRYRLSAQVIRDQALAAAGLLTERLGGPSVRPYQPKGLWKEIASDTDYNQSHGADLYRRSLYTYWKRTVMPPAMAAFDASSRETCTVRPSRTNTPLQALTLMNDATFVEAARVLAERVLAEAGPDDRGRLVRAFRLVTAREPTTAETSILLAGLARQRQQFQARPAAARQLAAVGEAPRNEQLDATEVAAWTTITGILLNLDETISRE